MLQYDNDDCDDIRWYDYQLTWFFYFKQLGNLEYCFILLPAQDVHRIGGIPAVMKYLLKLGWLHGDCMTDRSSERVESRIDPGGPKSRPNGRFFGISCSEYCLKNYGMLHGSNYWMLFFHINFNRKCNPLNSPRALAQFWGHWPDHCTELGECSWPGLRCAGCDSAIGKAFGLIGLRLQKCGPQGVDRKEFMVKNQGYPLVI